MKSIQFKVAVSMALCSEVLTACVGQIKHLTESSNMTSYSTGDRHTPSKTAGSTFCFGRFLIDLPLDSSLAGASYKFAFSKVEQAVPMSKETFDSELAEKELRLKSIKHKVEPSLLRKITSIDRETRVIAYWEQPYFTSQIMLDGYRWQSGTRFLLVDEADSDRQEFAVDRMKSSLIGLRSRQSNDIPTEGGFCFEGGFIASEKWKNEQIDAGFRLGGYPDVTLQIFVMPKNSPGPVLTDRMGGVIGSLGAIASRVRVLRSGNRNSGAYKGQEYLVSAPNSGGMQAHSLIWETQGEGTLETPFVNIELVTGGSDANGNPQRTALSDEQVLALWDRIIASFRIRPVATPAAKTSDAADAHKRPLGERAMTGRTCPQSGWWRCEDFGSVVGGRDRYFAEGDVMSGVEVPAKPDFWERLRGEQPIGRRATRWELVGHATKDEPPTED